MSDGRDPLAHGPPGEGLAEERPWGGFVVLHQAPGYKVKRVRVHPGGRLSLQSHRHRTEHWYVVHGEATVTVSDSRGVFGPGESVDVPVGAIHRLENFGLVDLIVVEVQRGPYLGEDDITRYDDVYRRHEPEPADAAGSDPGRGSAGR